MGVTVELEADDLWCRSAEDAARAAEIIGHDDWIHPYHLQVTPTECSSGDRKGDWFLEIDHFQGDHWHDYDARKSLARDRALHGRRCLARVPGRRT